MNNPSKPLILIVEDNQSVRKLIEFKLQRAGYQLAYSENGAEGWSKIQELQPDLVVLDVMLPGMTGFEVLRKVRNDEQLQDTKVLMLTTKTREEDIEHGFELDADEYMGKPFKVNELMIRLERLLESEQ
jgi:two-component system alkaline phosphatase synthesis response regulator PhoP